MLPCHVWFPEGRRAEWSTSQIQYQLGTRDFLRFCDFATSIVSYMNRSMEQTILILRCPNLWWNKNGCRKCPRADLHWLQVSTKLEFDPAMALPCLMATYSHMVIRHLVSFSFVEWSREADGLVEAVRYWDRNQVSSETCKPTVPADGGFLNFFLKWSDVSLFWAFSMVVGLPRFGQIDWNRL